MFIFNIVWGLKTPSITSTKLFKSQKQYLTVPKFDKEIGNPPEL